MSSRNLSELVYCSLLEEESTPNGWSKSTVEYVLSHRSHVTRTIRGIAKNIGRICQQSEVDDIHEELLHYLYKSDDYSIEKACNTETGTVVSLDGYIHTCIKNCVKRYITEEAEHERKQVRETVREEEGKELSLFDTIPDKADQGFDNIFYNLESLCEAYESCRYQSGIDIFQMWYIRLLTLQYKKKEAFDAILEIIGVSNRDILNLKRTSTCEGPMLSIAKAVSLTGLDKSIEIIKKHTYSANQIEQVVKLF